MGVPVERPKETLTAEDIARQERAEALRNQQEPNRDVNIVWDEPETERRIALESLVVDPPDGRIPITAEMQQAVDDWGPRTTASASRPGPISISGIGASRRASRR